MCYSYCNRYCRRVFGERWWEQIVSNLLVESVAALTLFISFSTGVVCKYLHLGISSNGSVLFCGSFDWSTVLSKKSEVLRLRRNFNSDQLQWAELSTIRLSHLCTEFHGSNTCRVNGEWFRRCTSRSVTKWQWTHVSNSRCQCTCRRDPVKSRKLLL